MPELWDADPDVCCAAYQLGACEHTEAWTEDDIAAALAWEDTPEPVSVDDDDSPF